MTRRRTVWRAVTGAQAAIAALAILAGPASAATGGASGTLNNKMYGSLGFEGLPGTSSFVACDNLFQGHVTSTNRNSPTTVIDQATIDNCTQGVSVTAADLPWTLAFHNTYDTHGNLSNSQFTLKPFDMNITTSQGTCRYTGTASGTLSNPPEADQYTLHATLTRQTAGCGGDSQITVSGSEELALA